jgi:hypothetical protein
MLIDKGVSNCCSFSPSLYNVYCPALQFITLYCSILLCGYHQLYLGVVGLHVVPFGLLVVAALNVPAGTGVPLCVGRPSYSFLVPVRPEHVVSNNGIRRKHRERRCT